MTHVRLKPDAAAEYWKIAAYYEDKAQGLGVDFTIEFDVAIDRISEYPKHCAARADETRRLLINRFPYVIVYTLERDEIVVLAVAHCRRNEGYWRR